MRKSTLAMAIAAALAGFGTVAHADTTLYGSARVSVDYEDANSNYVRLPNGQLQRVSIGADAWDVVNNASRLGVRGEEDLGGGLSAIYQYEFGVDPTEGGNFSNGRPAWVGLKGASWGSFTIGTQWTPYYNAVGGVGDVFNSVKVYDNDTYLGNSFGVRMDNSILYSTPNWSGFSAQAMLVVNGSCGIGNPQTTADYCKTNATNRLSGNVSDGVDLWNIGVSYKNGPIIAGATYVSLGDNDFFNKDADQWGVAVGYNGGPFALSVTYENGGLNTLNVGDTQNIYLVGQYTFGNNIIRGSYGYSNPDKGRLLLANGNIMTQSEVNNWALGYQYNFSKRTRAWVEYIGQDVDSKLVGDKQTISIGTRHDF